MLSISLAKKNNIFMVLSIICLFAFSSILLFSNEFISIVYKFLETVVFHRSFKLEKWLTTIESFFLIPSFILVCVNAIGFPKYSDKQKLILVISLIVDFIFLILYSTAVRTNAHTNADLASELLLAKECLREHTFMPTSWCYSTEIRCINTELISAPLFLFTNNWNAVKTLTTFFCCIALFFSCFFLLNQLNIKILWLKLLLCLFTCIPFSFSSWYVISWGTYYIPHTIFAMLYIGVFIKLTCNENLKHKKAIFYFFCVWAFLSGLSSIRYVMNFVFPLVLAIFIIELASKGASEKTLRGFMLKNKFISISIIGLILSGAGYLANVVVLEHFFTFSNWSKISFNTYGSIKILDIISSILFNFGYQDNIAVLTINGLINLLIYCALILFITMTIKILKNKLSLKKSHEIFLVFFITSILFESFVYFHTELLTRYYIPLLLLIFPCFGILYTDQNNTLFKRYVLIVCWTIILIPSSLTTIQHSMVTDENLDKYEVTDFLKKQNFKFGYATFANANTFTHLTNGKVAIGNFGKRAGQDGISGGFNQFSYSKWLTPKWYYESDWDNEPIFFLVTQKQFDENKDMPIFENGTEIFSNDFYRIFEYKDNTTFKNSFEVKINE